MRQLLYDYEISIVIRVCHGSDQLILVFRHWLGLFHFYVCSAHHTILWNRLVQLNYFSNTSKVCHPLCVLKEKW